MKSRPRIGEVGELAIPTDMKHAVEFHGDGMPAVVSTPHLVGFLERTARETIAACLEADERSVGVELDIRHSRADARRPDDSLHRARHFQSKAARCTFQIEARDQHEVIVRGLHKRAVNPHRKISAAR